MLKKLYLFVSGLLSFYTIAAQDSTAVKRNTFSGFPVVYTTPETGWAFGGLGVYAFRMKGMPDDSRPSQVTVAAAYTLNKQILLFAPFQLFWKEAKRNAYGELGYYRYNYFYYGIGNDAKRVDEETFDVNFPRVRLNGMARVRPNTYLGIRYWYDGYDIQRIEEDGLLDTNRPTGVNDGTEISGAGFISNYDTRDNIFYTREGYYIELGTLHAGKALGGDFNFNKYSLDARKFIPIGKGALGINAYLEFTTGNAPFYQLSFLGGGRRMRGYLEGRYRDKQYSMLQTEYRFPLFWRFKGAVFAATGGVDNTVGGIFSNLRFAYGGGLRFLINPQEGVHVRMDYGIGEKGETGFYLTIGEAF